MWREGQRQARWAGASRARRRADCWRRTDAGRKVQVVLVVMSTGIPDGEEERSVSSRRAVEVRPF